MAKQVSRSKSKNAKRTYQVGQVVMASFPAYGFAVPVEVVEVYSDGKMLIRTRPGREHVIFQNEVC